MSVHKQFVHASASVFLGSLTIGSILSTPTPLDAVLAYQKPERAPEVRVYTPPSEHFSEIKHEAPFEPKQEEASEVTVASLEAAEEILELSDTEVIVNEVPLVPFYSQFSDITSPSWKKVGCGIASLAMLIDYYTEQGVVVDTLLQEGINAGAYLDSAGWTYAGLIGISKKYGMDGETRDYGNLSMDTAYEHLSSALTDGPVMASVHYTFQKSNPIPHLVIINGIKDNKVFYNDPAEENGGGSISVAQFQSAWKKRFIVFRPTE